MSEIWLFAEQDHGIIARTAFELLTRALALAAARPARVNAVVCGTDLATANLQELCARGVDRVVAIEAPELANFQIEFYAAALQQVLTAFQPDVLLAAATTTGRTLMPYVAMRAHTGLTADCTALAFAPDSDLLLQTRPAIGGNIMATIQCATHRPQMATVRPHSAPPAPVRPGLQGEIVRLPLNSPPLTRIQRLGFTPAAAAASVQDARRLVVAGRGIKKAANLVLVRELAAALHAEVGGTREVVDRGWLDYPCQIGLSGKTVTPELYVGVGVSGAVQHLAGMQTARTIIAINSDPEAPIFQVADYGICGDLFAVVPALIKELQGASHA